LSRSTTLRSMPFRPALRLERSGLERTEALW